MPVVLERQPYAYLLIVRRECEDTLAFLQDTFARRPGIRVIADRRVGERRSRRDQVATERRRRDRRSEMPLSWDVADYVLVPDSDSNGLDRA